MAPNPTSTCSTSSSSESSFSPPKDKSTCLIRDGGVQLGISSWGRKGTAQRFCKWTYESGLWSRDPSPLLQLIKYGKASLLMMPCFKHLGAMELMFFWTCSEMGRRSATPVGCEKPCSSELARSWDIKTTIQYGSASAIFSLQLTKYHQVSCLVSLATLALYTSQLIDYQHHSVDRFEWTQPVLRLLELLAIKTNLWYDILW